MSTSADDASAAFEWARLQEGRATEDALVDVADQEASEDPRDELLRRIAESEGEAPSPSPAPPTGDPAAAEAPSDADQDPEADGAAEGEGDLEIFDFMDTVKSTLRGVAQGPMDLADNAREAINSTVGEPLMRIMTMGASDDLKEKALEEFRKKGPSGREIIDERFGAPESLVGMFAQGGASQLVFVIPGSRALKAVGMGTIAAGTVAGASTAAGTSRPGDGNLSTLAVTMGEGTVFDNPFTQALSVAESDSDFERIAKTAIEDIGLSWVADGSAAAAARLWRKVHVATPDIDAAAGRSGVEVDGDLRQSAEELAELHAKKGLIDETLEQTEEAAAQADEAAAFRGDEDVPDPDLDEAADAVHSELTEAQAALQQQIDDADAALAALAETTETDGRYVEAYRQMMKDIASGNTNQALGDAATRNMPQRGSMPARTLLGNFLEANEGTLEALLAAYKSGDMEALEQLFGEVLDNTNYNNITGEGGIAQLIEAQGAIFGNSTASPRVQTTWGLVDVGEQTVADLEDMVTSAGGSMAALERSLGQLGADVSRSITDFRQKFNQLRAAEVSVAHRLGTLLDQWEALGPGGGNDALRIEILRAHELAAHLTEIRSGGSSEIAGALGDHRLTFEPMDFDALLSAERAVQTEEMAQHVAKHGGANKIDPMIEALLHSRKGGVNPLLNTNAQARTMVTLGDVAYEAFISNILSSPTTQTINITSNAIRGMAWDPGTKFFEASSRALFQQDLTGFKALIAHVEGLKRGALDAFMYDASLGGSRLQTAWRRGERVTGRPGGLFTEATVRPDRSLLNTGGLSKLVRDGVGVRIPGTRLLGAGKNGQGLAVPLLPLPKSTRNGMADWLATRTGPVSRAINYMGNAMGWIGRSLAVGDELFAGMSYRAQLYADSVETAVGEGLTGSELAKRVDFIRRNAPQIDLLKKRATMTDPATRSNLNQLAEINQKARSYAERSTYATQAPGSRLMEQARQTMPGIRWFAPFIRTPLNLAAQGVTDFSPLGPAAKFVREAVGSNPNKKQAMAEAMGRLTMVGGIYAAAWQMAEDGKFTGGGPHNPAEREVWLTANQPYSVKIGDKWFSYNRFDPIAMPLGILADLMYLNGRTPGGQATENKLHETVITVLGNAVKSRTFLQGIAEMVHVIQTPDSKYTQSLLVSKVQNTLIPGSRMFASLERGGIPLPEDLTTAITEGDVEGGLLGDFLNGRPEKQMVDTRNPIVHFGTLTARDLPAGIQEGFVAAWNAVLNEKNQIAMVPDRDFFGEVRSTPAGLGPDFIVPFQFKEEGEEDPVAEELSRLGYGHSTRTRFGKLYGLELTPEQRDRFHLFFVQPTKDTKPIREALEALMLDENGNLSEGWQSLGDPVSLELGEERGGKLQQVDRIVGRYMKSAKAKMLETDEEVRKAFTAKRKAAVLSRGQEGRDALERANETSPLLEALE